MKSSFKFIKEIDNYERYLIEKYGGKIWVEPALKGNAFKFQITTS